MPKVGTLFRLSNLITANQSRDIEKFFFAKCSQEKTEQVRRFKKKFRVGVTFWIFLVESYQCSTEFQLPDWRWIVL